MLALRGQLVYSYPEQINELNTKVRLTDDLFNRAFNFDNRLEYQEYNLRQGQSVQIGDLNVQLLQFIPNPQHPDYQPQEGDIAIGAILQVTTPEGTQYQARPIYLIRGNQGLGIQDMVAEIGLNTGFARFDPNTETGQFYIAQSVPPSDFDVPVEVATDSLRSDYIVLEAIEFPGINYFWIGTTLMMIGLTISMAHRISQKYR
jgi:cytochrome c-type biogenesis protein CcmF